MRVLGYIRVSTEKQEESLDVQKTLIDNYSRQIKAEQFLCFIDDGVGGQVSIEKRPGLLKLLTTVKKGDRVVVQKRDRLARDLLLILTIEKEISKRGAKIISLAGEGTQLDGYHGNFITNIFDSFSQMERAIIKERTKAMMMAKREKGLRLGKIPYGKKLSADGIHLENCEEELQLIQQMIKWSEKYTFVDIEKMMKKKEIKNRQGNYWDDAMINYIVKKFKFTK